VYNALMKKVSTNIWKLNFVAAFTDMMFFIPVLIPFLGSLGLSMQEILIVEAVFSVTMVLLEVPSGYFADVFGRKLSLCVR
jgi:MFS family permease